MRRVPTSWVASGNPNSITDACIHFTQKFVKIRDGEPPGWHILQTFEWGRRRRRRLHEGERKAGHARGYRAESDGSDAWVRARLPSARYSPRRLRGFRVSGTVPHQWHRPSSAALPGANGTLSASRILMSVPYAMIDRQRNHIADDIENYSKIFLIYYGKSNFDDLNRIRSFSNQLHPRQ